MARIPEQTIDRIRESADILDVVGDYVQLKRKGRNWFGLCPFHQEKTPSFSVNQEKQIFHCFGCGRGGNAITFIMEIERVEFVDAVKRLGEKTGIAVEFSGDADPRHKATVQQISELYERATNLYRKLLVSEKGAKVREYLEERGIGPQAQELFRLGYVPDQWDTLVKSLKTADYSSEALNQSGLFMKGQRGPYDRFRGRIMFPISHATGRVVALAGRVFGTDEQAKYMNSPESPIYHKSEILYGLSLTKQAVREADRVIIVEGYFDLIQLYQAGITTVVAVSGTALTDNHARELGKLTPHGYLAYDGDSAGIQAAIRGGYTLMRAGLDPRIVELPPDIDPDDWVRSAGPEPFNRAVDQALPLLEFHHRHFSGDLTTTGDLHRFLEAALRELAPIRDRLVRDLNIKQLAELSGIDERRLHETMQTLPRQSSLQADAKAAPARAAIIEPTRSHKAQMALIRLAFEEHEDVLNLLVDEVTPELFIHPALRQIWDLAGPMLKAGTIPEAGQIMSRLADPSIQQLLSAMLMEEDSETDRLALAIDCLTRLYRDQLEIRIEARRRDLKAAEQATGSPPPELLREWTDLNHSLAELGRHFDKYRA